MKERCFLFFSVVVFAKCLICFAYINCLCYFSLSWMSPLSVNVVFFRRTSAMHFYKQLKLVLFRVFVCIVSSFLSFLNLVIGWMYLFIFFDFEKCTFRSCFTLVCFSVIHAVYVSQNSTLSFAYYVRTFRSQSFTVTQGMWIISLPSRRVVQPSLIYSRGRFVQWRRNRVCRHEARTYVCILSTLELYHA